MDDDGKSWNSKPILYKPSKTPLSLREVSGKCAFLAILEARWTILGAILGHLGPFGGILGLIISHRGAR